MSELIAKFERITGEYPYEPVQQLKTACEHCFASYFSVKSRAFRASRGVDKSACAVICQGMVFGNLTTLSSGCGTAHSRNPQTGSETLSGFFLSRTESADDVVQGTRQLDISKELQERMPDVYMKLKRSLKTLEREFKDGVSVEFTLESGQLYILSAGKSPRTAEAAMKIAVDLVREKSSITQSAKVEGFEPAAPPFTRPLGQTQKESPEEATAMSVEDPASVSITKKEALQRIPVADLPSGLDPTWLRSEYATKVLEWADEVRTMSIMANCSTPADARSASLLHADGIGIVEIETLIGAPCNKNIMKEFSTATNPEQRQASLKALTSNLTDQFSEILYLAPGVTINAAGKQRHADDQPIDQRQREATTDKLVVVNALLFDSTNAHAFVLMPEFLECQVRAIIKATLDTQNGINMRFEVNLIIPVLISDHELDYVIPHLQNAVDSACREHALLMQAKLAQAEEAEAKQNGVPTAVEGTTHMYMNRSFANEMPLACNFGVCITTPRACIRAATLVKKKAVQFMCFDLNELTSSTIGVNSTESETFMQQYLDKHILAANPFFTIDEHGVGAMIARAVKDVRAIREDFKFMAFGLQIESPASIRFLQTVGVDVVSTDAKALPVAKIAAAQSQIDKQIKHDNEWGWTDTFKLGGFDGISDNDFLGQNFMHGF